MDFSQAKILFIKILQTVVTSLSFISLNTHQKNSTKFAIFFLNMDPAEHFPQPVKLI